MTLSIGGDRLWASTARAAVLVAVVAGASWSSEALAQFGVGGGLRLTAPDTGQLVREVPYTPLTYVIQDSESHVHSWPEGECGYDGACVADVQGYIGASARAWQNNHGSASAEAWGVFNNHVTFTVEPDYYPDGVYVNATGSLTGSLSATGFSGNGNVSVFSQARLGPMGNLWTFTDGFNLADTTHVINEVFTMNNELVAPGTTLTEPLQVTLEAWATLRANAGVTHEGTSADYTSNFLSTLSYDTLDAPDGVTWTSASGTFLPEPSMLLLFGLGYPLLRRRRQGLG